MNFSFPAAEANLESKAARTVSKVDVNGHELVVYRQKLTIWNEELHVQLCSLLSTYHFSPGNKVDNKMESWMLNL